MVVFGESIAQIHYTFVKLLPIVAELNLEENVEIHSVAAGSDIGDDAVFIADSRIGRDSKFAFGSATCMDSYVKRIAVTRARDYIRLQNVFDLGKMFVVKFLQIFIGRDDNLVVLNGDVINFAVERNSGDAFALVAARRFQDNVVVVLTQQRQKMFKVLNRDGVNQKIFKETVGEQHIINFLFGRINRVAREKIFLRELPQFRTELAAENTRGIIDNSRQGDDLLNLFESV